MQRKKPAPGEVSYNEQTFDKLVTAAPEPLHGRLRITHALLLNLLERDEDTVDAVVRLVTESTPDEARGVRSTAGP